MRWILKIKSANRDQAVAVYRYLQKVFAVKKADVQGLDDSSYQVTVSTKEVGETMIRAIKDKFE